MMLLYFCYLITISLRKWVAGYLNKPKFHLSKMLWAKFGWNKLCCSDEEDENMKKLQTDRRVYGQLRHSEKFTWAY